MIELPRGIDPKLLVSQVRNTMPYLFDDAENSSALAQFPPAMLIRKFDAEPRPLTHSEYFKLCVSAHYLTCGTPVPTDVDNQIRQKLWPERLPLEDMLEMAKFVIDSRSWDFVLVTERYARGARESEWANQALSGHLGEWFTIAAAAYCALSKCAAPEAAQMKSQVFDQISDEVRRHSEIFGSLWRANEGLGALKASASIAHNFGDLDRVMDMWDLNVGDRLRLEFYKLGSQPFDSNRKLRYQGRLWVAGELYKSVIQGSSLALENHRHFALRKPRCLRKSREYLVPCGPFFDRWGVRVAQGLAANGKPSEETLEVFDMLAAAWERQPKTWAYGRGLRGFLETHSGLKSDGLTQDPSRRAMLKTPQERFEQVWADEAVRLMDDIPSRA